MLPGDVLYIKSEIIEVKDKTIRFIHTMYNSETGTVVATSELVAAHIDRKERKACSFPKEIANKCTALIRKIT